MSEMNVFTIKREALTNRAQLSIAGARCELATNSKTLLSALPAWCMSQDFSGDQSQFTIDVLVDDKLSGAVGRPHFRGLHHVVIASFGESVIFVFDLLRRKVSGVVPKAVAQDQMFWSATLLPIAIGVLGATVGVLPVHCACVSVEGSGLLIAGASGAGKSTLSVALAQSGIDFVSDDWTFISRRNGRLAAHSVNAPIKLLPDALSHFPALRAKPLCYALNGELAYEVDPEEMRVNAIGCCVPRWIIFPERSDALTSELIPVTSEETRAYIENSVERLPAEVSIAGQQRAALITRLATLPSWSFRYGGNPQHAARELRRLFGGAAGVAA